MGLFNWVHRLFPNREKIEHGQATLLPVDTSVLSNVMARASDRDQAKKVIRAAQQLESIWTNEENRNILRVTVMVDKTYPHLEKMADKEPLTKDWLAELSKAIELTANAAEDLVKQQDELLKVLDETLRRSK